MSSSPLVFVSGFTCARISVPVSNLFQFVGTPEKAKVINFRKILYSATTTSGEKFVVKFLLIRWMHWKLIFFLLLLVRRLPSYGVTRVTFTETSILCLVLVRHQQTATQYRSWCNVINISFSSYTFPCDSFSTLLDFQSTSPFRRRASSSSTKYFFSPLRGVFSP